MKRGVVFSEGTAEENSAAALLLSDKIERTCGRRIEMAPRAAPNEHHFGLVYDEDAQLKKAVKVAGGHPVKIVASEWPHLAK